jgi:hypothetical protein
VEVTEGISDLREASHLASISPSQANTLQGGQEHNSISTLPPGAALSIFPRAAPVTPSGSSRVYPNLESAWISQHSIYQGLPSFSPGPPALVLPRCSSEVSAAVTPLPSPGAPQLLSEPWDDCSRVGFPPIGSDCLSERPLHLVVSLYILPTPWPSPRIHSAQLQPKATLLVRVRSEDSSTSSAATQAGNQGGHCPSPSVALPSLCTNQA